MSDAFAGGVSFASEATPFSAGFASRHDDIGDALRRAFAPPPGFAAAPPGVVVTERAERADGPKHFHPADRDTNPTEGWDPFDAQAPATPDLAEMMRIARAEGYADGLRVAREGAANEGHRNQILVEGMAHAFANAGWIDRERFAHQIRQTVMTLVGTLVGEAGVDGDHLTGRVLAATDMLADAAESAMLRLNPADLALVEGRLPETIFPVADATIARGAFALEAASTIVEDGPERWLTQLAEVIDRVPLPKC